MTDPEISVTLTAYVFSIGELQEFLDTARAIPTMANNAPVVVECEAHTGLGAVMHTLRASTASKGETSELPY